MFMVVILSVSWSLEKFQFWAPNFLVQAYTLPGDIANIRENVRRNIYHNPTNNSFKIFSRFMLYPFQK